MHSLRDRIVSATFVFIINAVDAGGNSPTTNAAAGVAATASDHVEQNYIDVSRQSADVRTVVT